MQFTSELNARKFTYNLFCTTFFGVCDTVLLCHHSLATDIVAGLKNFNEEVFLLCVRL